MKDVFICHASEDKENVVTPIVDSFKDHGISYWLDRAEINWGDSLIEKINEGLSNSKYVIVVLSDSFLAKRWPQRELNSVLNIEASTGEVKVLPLIVGDARRIIESFTLLNDKTYIQWNGEPSGVINALQGRLNSSTAVVNTSGSNAGELNIPLPRVKRQVTQREKDVFLKRVFSEILGYFKEALAKLETHHEGIETDLDEIHKFKFACKIYLDGEVGAECKIWLGGPTNAGISYVEGRNIDINNDNSYNDWLSVDDDGSEVFLKPSSMNIHGTSGQQMFSTGIEGAEYFWRRLIANME